MLELKVRVIGVGSRDEGLLHLGATSFDLILIDDTMGSLPETVNSIIIVIGSEITDSKARGIIPKPVLPNRLLTLCSELISVPEKSRFPLNSRILLIDGSIPQLKLIKGILSKLGYVYVDSSNHGLEALDRLATERYHLVIFGDTKIPKKDAKSIAKALDKAYSGKNRSLRPKKLLILESSNGSKDSIKKQESYVDINKSKLSDKYDGLFDGYMSKPLFIESVQTILAEIYSQ